jgi:hypothetical protein
MVIWHPCFHSLMISRRSDSSLANTWDCSGSAVIVVVRQHIQFNGVLKSIRNKGCRLLPSRLHSSLAPRLLEATPPQQELKDASVKAQIGVSTLRAWHELIDRGTLL